MHIYCFWDKLCEHTISFATLVRKSWSTYFFKKKKWGNHLNIRLILYKPTGGFYKGHGWAHVLVVNMRVTYYREEFPKAHTQEAHTCGLGPLRRADTQQLTLEYVSKREERRGPPPHPEAEGEISGGWSWEAPAVPRTQLRQCNPTEPLERVKNQKPNAAL